MINEDVKKLLEYHNIPTKKLDDILKLHFQGKEKLLSVLGLTEENGWRTEVPMPEVHEAKSAAISFVNEISMVCEQYKAIRTDAGYMMDGKSKVRIGKIIHYYLSNFYFEFLRLIVRYNKEIEKKEVKGLDSMLKDNLSATYNLLKEAKITFKDEDIWDEEKINNLIAKFSCYYGDYIKSKRIGVISGNPLDYFLLSGTGTSFSSCIRMGGEYFNSCLHYLCNPNTIISYTTDDSFVASDSKIKSQMSNIPTEVLDKVHKKIGRSLFYLNRGLIISSRFYGSYYEEENKAFIEFLMKKMGGEFKKCSSNMGDSGAGVKGNSTYFHNHATGAYIDFGQMKLFTREKFDKIDFHSGKCLECGDDIDKSPTGGVCQPCKEGYPMCSVCGKKRSNRMLERYDIYVCSDCFKEYVRCQSCGHDAKKEDIIPVYFTDGKSRNICKWCFEKHKISCKKCKDCKKYFTAEILKDGYCKECLEKSVEEEG